MVADPPLQGVTGVGHRLPRFRDENQEHPLTEHLLFDDVGRHSDCGVDSLPQPIDVQLGADDDAGLILDAEDQRTATRGIGHAGDLIRELGCRLRIFPSAGLNVGSVTSTGFFLEVDGLGFPRRADSPITSGVEYRLHRVDELPSTGNNGHDASQGAQKIEPDKPQPTCTLLI